MEKVSQPKEQPATAQNQQQNGQQQQSQPKQKKEIHVSAATKDKAEAAKAYIERKYAKMIQEEKNKKETWDLLYKKMEALSLTQPEQELVKREILLKESENSRKRRQKVTCKDFDPLAIIGRGAFGEVRVCRNKETKEIIAIKKMKKQEMLFKNQIGHIRAERDILASLDNPWIVELKCSFQDEKYLYLVMEFLVGGDLMTVLMKKDILTEEESKFYMAELVLSVDSVHRMNYIHRDLKPDNILLTKDGHIKLSDFGLCKHTEIKRKIDFGKKADNLQQEFAKNPASILTKRPQNYTRNRQLAFSTVGTPDYIAPEVFGQQGYTETVDWWSLGVILFEMLVGYPPFFSEDPSLTCQKILHWKKTFMIPPEANLSPAAADLIKRLIADPVERLGINGVEEIKAHPFFCGIDWKKIRDKKAPYIPEIKSETDVCNFDKFEEEEPWLIDDHKTKRNRKMDQHFEGYSFKRDVEQERSALVQALENLESSRSSPPRQNRLIKGQSPKNSNHQLDYGENQTEKEKPLQIPINSYHVGFGKNSSPGRQASPGSPTQQKITSPYYLQQINKMQYVYDANTSQKSPRAAQSPNPQQQTNMNTSANGSANNIIKIPNKNGQNSGSGQNMGPQQYPVNQQNQTGGISFKKPIQQQQQQQQQQNLPNLGSGQSSSPKHYDALRTQQVNQQQGSPRNYNMQYNYMTNSQRNGSPPNYKN